MSSERDMERNNKKLWKNTDTDAAKQHWKMEEAYKLSGRSESQGWEEWQGEVMESGWETQRGGRGEREREREIPRDEFRTTDGGEEWGRAYRMTLKGVMIDQHTEDRQATGSQPGYGENTRSHFAQGHTHTPPCYSRLFFPSGLTLWERVRRLKAVAQDDTQWHAQTQGGFVGRPWTCTQTLVLCRGEDIVVNHIKNEPQCNSYPLKMNESTWREPSGVTL